MAQLKLVQIQSLHARSVQEAGLIVRIGGIALQTGPIVAILDDSAASSARTRDCSIWTPGRSGCNGQ
jgi:hypothetical protein